MCSTSTSQTDIMVNEQLTREAIRFSMKWSIDNIRAFQSYKTEVCSEGITMSELGMDYCHAMVQFGLVPCKKRDKDGDIKYLCLYLIANGLQSRWGEEDPELDELYAEFKLWVTTGKGEDAPVLISSPVVQHTFYISKHKWDAGEISHSVLFGTDNESGLIRDNCITIIADIVVYKDPQTARVYTPALPSPLQRFREFSQRQVKWYRSIQPPCGDFILVSSEGKEFHVNRFLLMAHSPVFAAMLTHDSKEKQESRCALEGVDEESVGILLEYLYSCGNETGKIVPDKAEKILKMADQYGMMDLRLACEGVLAQIVTAENAVHYLMMACQRGLSLLKEAALKAIPKNLGRAIKGQAMEEAMHEPEVIRTIMEHCSKRMKLIEEPPPRIH